MHTRETMQTQPKGPFFPSTAREQAPEGPRARFCWISPEVSAIRAGGRAARARGGTACGGSARGSGGGQGEGVKRGVLGVWELVKLMSGRFGTFLHHRVCFHSPGLAEPGIAVKTAVCLACSFDQS